MGVGGVRSDESSALFDYLGEGRLSELVSICRKRTISEWFNWRRGLKVNLANRIFGKPHIYKTYHVTVN